MTAQATELYTVVKATEDDIFYMKQAVEKAAESGDTSTKNGAVLVPAEACLVHEAMGGLRCSHDTAEAANGIPTRFGVQATDKRLNERPLKYNVIEHAEDGACYEAARRGISSEGGTLYCPWYACSSCAIAIICSGIKTVIGHTAMMERTPERWMEDVELGFELLKEAGVQCLCISEPLGMKTLMNGEEIEI